MSAFHLFPDLPTELRLLIWEYSIYMQPRIVDTSWGKIINRVEVTIDGLGSATRRSISSRARTPAILYVSRESRSVSESHYRKSSLCQGWKSREDYNMSSLGQGWRSREGQPSDFIWLNFDIDTVLMHQTQLCPARPEVPDWNLVQRLHVTAEYDYMDDFPPAGPKFDVFGALKSVDILFGGGIGGIAYYWGRSLTLDAERWDWACDPSIIRVVDPATGEIFDYDRDKELRNFDRRTRTCSETGVHIGAHDWDWAKDDGRWYAKVFGDI